MEKNYRLIFDALHCKLRLINNRLNEIQLRFRPKSGDTAHDWLFKLIPYPREHMGYIGKSCSKIIDNHDTWMSEVLFLNQEEQMLLDSLAASPETKMSLQTQEKETREHFTTLFSYYKTVFPIISKSKPSSKEKKTFQAAVTQLPDIYRAACIQGGVYDHMILCHAMELLTLHGSIGLFSCQPSEHANRTIKRHFNHNTSLSEQRSLQTFQKSVLRALLL